LVTEPDGSRSLISLQANFSQDDMEVRVGILLGMQAPPSAETNLAPTRVDEGHIFLWLVPAIWFLEGKATTVLAGPPAAHSIWKLVPSISVFAVSFELIKMSKHHVKQASWPCGIALN
jgi:hypothetical protein